MYKSIHNTIENNSRKNKANTAPHISKFGVVQGKRFGTVAEIVPSILFRPIVLMVEAVDICV